MHEGLRTVAIGYDVNNYGPRLKDGIGRSVVDGWAVVNRITYSAQTCIVCNEPCFGSDHTWATTQRLKWSLIGNRWDCSPWKVEFLKLVLILPIFSSMNMLTS